jgi:hypothetical protein
MTDHNADLAHGLEPASPEKTPEVGKIDTLSTVDLALKSISLAESSEENVSQASIQATDGYSSSGSQHDQRFPELHLYNQPYPAGLMHYEHPQGQAGPCMTSQPTALQNHCGECAYPHFGPPVSGYPRYPYDPRMLPQYISTGQSMPSFNGAYPPQYPQQGYIAYPMGIHSQLTPPYTRGPTHPPIHMMHSKDTDTSELTARKVRTTSKARHARIKEECKHQCPVCTKSFARPSTLETHGRVHSGVKPYACRFPGCHRGPTGSRFSVLSNKTRHEKTAHKEWYAANAASLKQVPVEKFL